MDHLLLLLLSAGVLTGTNDPSDPEGGVRLVGGASRCSGTLEGKRDGEWRLVDNSYWILRSAGMLCEHLDCGSAVSMRTRTETSSRSVWRLHNKCFMSTRDVSTCVTSFQASTILNLTCSDSVRLQNGSSLCSGRLQVKTNQTNQRWSPVCEADFDLQDAEVVCRELGCGSPVALRGALYGDVQALLWSPEFQCGGHESALLDCSSSGSGRTSCSPGTAAGLTCSEFPELRLVGGASRCAGTLQLNRDGEWRPVFNQDWSLKKEAAAVCRLLDCGSAVFLGWRTPPTRNHTRDFMGDPVWSLRSECVHSAVDLRECSKAAKSTISLNITCSDSVRLQNGSSLCSGRLQVKTNQTNQRWSPVCEADFDLQDAEVVCRELGCGSPVALRGALYGDVQALLWSPEFQCGGHESALLDCSSSGSGRTSCSPGTAAGLTCSEPDDVRLVGGASRCAGTVEVRGLGEWRPTYISDLNVDTAASFCEHLDCGSVVEVSRTSHATTTKVWMTQLGCLHNISDLRRCATLVEFPLMNNVTCSDLLFQPIISLSSPTYVGVSQALPQGLEVIMGSAFTVSCSIQPQYPGGSFQLTFTYSNTSHSSTQPAVNHSAHFLFPAAEPAHQGNYSCVYQVHVFQHNFSSESRVLRVSVTDPTPTMIRWVVVPVILVLQLLLTALWFHWKASRLLRRRKAEQVYYNRAERGRSSGTGVDPLRSSSHSLPLTDPFSS